MSRTVVGLGIAALKLDINGAITILKGLIDEHQSVSVPSIVLDVTVMWELTIVFCVFWEDDARDC
jgi:hypothetical protein